MSKFITADEAVAVQPWQAPEVGGEGARSSDRHPTAKELEEVTEAAFSEAYERGLAEGRAAAAKELAAKIEHFDKVLASLQSPLETLDDSVTDILSRIASTIAGVIIQQELEASPQRVASLVRSAIDRMPESAEPVKVWLHPDDAAIVRELATLEEINRPWRLFEDASLSRGGCRVESAMSALDATIDTRLRELRSVMLDHDVARPQGAYD